MEYVTQPRRQRTSSGARNAAWPAISMLASVCRPSAPASTASCPGLNLLDLGLDQDRV